MAGMKTAIFYKRTTHSGGRGPDKHFDGNGLYLRVMPSGSKQWFWRGTIRGKRREAGLGGYPLVSLREAREKAFELRREVMERWAAFVSRRLAAVAG